MISPEEVKARLIEAANRFIKFRPSDEPAAPPPEDLALKAMQRFWAQDEAMVFIEWLDGQIALAKTQRNSPQVRSSHPDLLTLLGYENGLETVKFTITNWRKPPENPPAA